MEKKLEEAHSENAELKAENEEANSKNTELMAELMAEHEKLTISHEEEV